MQVIGGAGDSPFDGMAISFCTRMLFTMVHAQTGATQGSGRNPPIDPGPHFS